MLQKTLCSAPLRVLTHQANVRQRLNPQWASVAPTSGFSANQAGRIGSGACLLRDVSLAWLRNETERERWSPNLSPSLSAFHQTCSRSEVAILDRAVQKRWQFVYPVTVKIIWACGSCGLKRNGVKMFPFGFYVYILCHYQMQTPRWLYVISIMCVRPKCLKNTCSWCPASAWSWPCSTCRRSFVSLYAASTCNRVFSELRKIPPLSCSHWGHLHMQRAPAGQPTSADHTLIKCTVVRVNQTKATDLPRALSYVNRALDASLAHAQQLRVRWWRGYFWVFWS